MKNHFSLAGLHFYQYRKEFDFIYFRHLMKLDTYSDRHSLYNQKISTKPIYIAFNLYFTDYDEDVLNTPFGLIFYNPCLWPPWQFSFQGHWKKDRHRGDCCADCQWKVEKFIKESDSPTLILALTEPLRESLWALSTFWY